MSLGLHLSANPLKKKIFVQPMLYQYVQHEEQSTPLIVWEAHVAE